MIAEILQLPAFHLLDNYLYILRWKDGTTAAVDPGDAEVISQALDERGWQLDYVLNTHHHWDHSDGNLHLKERFNCQIIRPAVDAARIPGIDTGVDESDTLTIGDSQIEILFIPGHTNGHIAYHFATEQKLFSGDVLFSLGCGRMFEGDAATFWNSMQKIMALPKNTMVYPAHEYTLANAAFAQQVMGSNPEFQAYHQHIKELRAADKPTVPVKLANEIALNPFLRCHQPEVLAYCKTTDPIQAFKTLRAEKDNF